MDSQHGTRQREISLLVLTEQAAEAIKGMLEEAEAGPASGMRISGTDDGDGIELEFNVADGPEDGDEVVTHGGVSVFLDALAAEALADLTLDVEAHGDHVHFSFDEQKDAES
jgi:Fe-S cluster assembly iron-binding protein IscA